MNTSLTNHNLDLTTWLNFTRDELKSVARKNGIGIPSNKADLARNLQRGFSDCQLNEEPRTFKVKVSI